VKSRIANRCEPAGKGNGRKVVAAFKSTLFNSCDRAGYINGNKVFAIAKSVASNSCDRVGKGNGNKIGAKGKSPSVYLSNSVGYSIVGKCGRDNNITFVTPRSIIRSAPYGNSVVGQCCIVYVIVYELKPPSLRRNAQEEKACAQEPCNSRYRSCLPPSLH
jgi:hypothetical protein